MARTAFEYSPVRRFCRQTWQLLLDRPLLSAVGLLLLVTLVFLAAPQIDFAVSGYFYDPLTGFNNHRTDLLGFARNAGSTIVKVVAIAFVAPLIIKLLAPESRLLLRPRATLFALAALAIGPGLIVNGLLKDYWGRARPREILEFGGNSLFTPVWWISDQCMSNCSFVSGEASSAFWLLVLAFVVPKAWRRVVAAAALLIAASVSLGRVAVGGHFVSDVLIAWLLTLIVILALDRLVLKGLPAGFDDAVDGVLTRGGRALRLWWVTRGRAAAPRDNVHLA